MAQSSFATRGTLKKLSTIEDYLKFYTTALSERFRLTYVDPFAGAGDVPLRGSLPLLDGNLDYDKTIAGSARIALNLQRPFHQYVLSDLKKANVTALTELRSQFPTLADRVRIEKGEANEIVRSYCQQHDERHDRAVVFLDPFGNQVRWETIELIARTKGIDLWYLFPAGMGVARQISQDASVQKDAERSLNEMFGDRSWFQAATKPQENHDLFDGARGDREKMSATADAITRHMISKMKAIFPGVVLDGWLPLGKASGHWYSLIFACSNDSRPAIDLAKRVARDIMTKK